MRTGPAEPVGVLHGRLRRTLRDPASGDGGRSTRLDVATRGRSAPPTTIRFKRGAIARGRKTRANRGVHPRIPRHPAAFAAPLAVARGVLSEVEGRQSTPRFFISRTVFSSTDCISDSIESGLIVSLRLDQSRSSRGTA